MGFFQAYKMAIKSIKANKGRSFLTMLGVIIGVASVISAVAFAQGSTKSITDSIQKLGTNLIQITLTGRNSNRDMSYEDLKKFAAENTEVISAVAPQSSTNARVKYGSTNMNTTIIATSPEYERIRNVHVTQGRFILDFDLEYRQNVALIGTAVVNELFENVNPIGEKIKINGQIFKIVGILEERANGAAYSDDDQIIIPISSSRMVMGTSSIRNFAVEAASAEKVDAAMDKLETFLLDIYKNENAFRVFDQSQMLETLDNVTGSMMIVLGGIAAISLIVGGIGIMNIMLVSVTERTKEIGIRKAIGAKRKNILTQFIIEAAVVTGMGGLIGVLLGFSIIKFVIGGLGLVPAVYSIPWALIAFGISLLVGIIFGLFPAYKAASLKPIEALRTE
ncbi:MAG: ABC transporter permease [Lutispora sp.]|jgi:putative ABC transport system permease protein|uniref:ABC transporter permease n=1 Tax=Lutispora sp. TaxID=2828727 RepID=UPI0035654EAF